MSKWLAILAGDAYRLTIRAEVRSTAIAPTTSVPASMNMPDWLLWV